MNGCSKYVLFAMLACGVAFATVLHFEPFKMREHLQAEINEVMDLLMKPRVLSRYMPAGVYESMGLNPTTRLMSFKWDNCGDKKKENLLIKDISFMPDPLKFPGPLEVSFNLDIKTKVSGGLKGSVLMQKRIGNQWIEVPCIGYLGSCTYNDICDLLGQITQCPGEFVEAGIPCNCPFSKGSYVLPNAKFQVDSFLPSGDYHIQANLSTKNQYGGCYDIYASIEAQ